MQELLKQLINPVKNLSISRTDELLYNVQWKHAEDGILPQEGWIIVERTLLDDTTHAAEILRGDKFEYDFIPVSDQLPLDAVSWIDPTRLSEPSLFAYRVVIVDKNNSRRATSRVRLVTLQPNLLPQPVSNLQVKLQPEEPWVKAIVSWERATADNDNDPIRTDERPFPQAQDPDFDWDSDGVYENSASEQRGSWSDYTQDVVKYPYIFY